MELAAQKREILGKSVKSLRQQGLVPAELYGRGLENIHLTVFGKDFIKVFKKAGENTVVNVSIGENKDIRPVLIYNVARHPISEEVLNIDFYQVRMDEAIRAKVPVEFIGDSAAVKEGGILVKAIQEIEVEALPADLPRSFIVDLSKIIEIGQAIHVKDLGGVNKNVKILIEPESVVAVVKPPITEEEEQTVAAEAVPDVAEVKVETEEKKAERQAAKEGEAEGSAKNDKK